MQTLLNPKCKYLLYGGAMAGGKSFLLRWAALIYLTTLYRAYNIEQIPMGLFCEDYPTLKDRQISRIEREFPKEFGKLKDDNIHGLSFQLSKELGSGIILLRNLDDPSKYMSTEFAGIFVDELTRNSEQTFQDLRNRLRYPGIEAVKFMGASNPGGIGHGWVKKYFIDKAQQDPELERFFYVHANAYDNQYISETYIKQLESLPEQKRKAYLEGSWDVFAGQFFTEFNRNIHSCLPFIPKNDLTIIGGMDWGRAAPFSFHLSVLQNKTYEGLNFHRVFTFLEVYGTEKTPKEWAQIIKERLEMYSLQPSDISWIEGDPAMFTKGNDNTISIADQFLREDIRINSGSNDRIGGWENMHKWLSIAPDGEPYWIITENCKNLIRTLPELIHDENKVEDVDTDGEDHAADSTRYMLKRLKWIDGKTGGVGKTESEKKLGRTARMQGDQQIGVKLDPFATAWKSKQGKPYYK